MSMIDQSAAFEHRLKVLEQQFQVAMKEVNQVLDDVAVALEGIQKGSKMAFEVFDGRIKELEKFLNSLPKATEETSIPAAGGREL